jgi:hypothetical protein
MSQQKTLNFRVIQKIYFNSSNFQQISALEPNLAMKLFITVRAGDLGHEGDLGHLDNFFSFFFFFFIFSSELCAVLT